MYGGDRVLLCDDHSLARGQLDSILTESGYRVIASTTNTDDTLERFQALLPEIVVINMSVRGTLDPLVTIRRMVRLLPSVRIFAAGTMSQSGSMMEALSAGALDFFIQPYQRQSVRNILRRNLG